MFQRTVPVILTDRALIVDAHDTKNQNAFYSMVFLIGIKNSFNDQTTTRLVNIRKALAEEEEVVLVGTGDVVVVVLHMPRLPSTTNRSPH